MSRAPLRKIRLGDLLVEQGVITGEQLAIALDEQKRSGRKLGGTLIALGFVSEDRLLALLAEQLGVEVVDLSHYRYKPEVVTTIPEQLARRYRVILLDNSPKQSVIGMADPTDLFAYDEACRLLGHAADIVLVREADMLRVFDNSYRHSSEIASLARDIGKDANENDIDRLLKVDDVADAPVVRLLHSLLEEAVARRASDIHIEPDEHVLRIRLRIDGMLHEQVVPDRRIAPSVVSRVKLMASVDISERRLPQDGRFNLMVKGTSLDVRLSTMPTQHGESVVMRLLEHDPSRYQLEKLGMPPHILARFRHQLHHPHGLILVTGPTGSGKTTTLYAALREINQPQRKIITAEDPVEYRMERINQVHVNTRIGLTFGNVLRTALRQDPDVILIGEMRDQETVEIGLRAAITGHLVLSTLHTNDAVSTAARLLDMGAEGYLVAAAMRALIAQRLIRRVCTICAEPVDASAQDAIWLQAMGRNPTDMELKVGAGCGHCNHTGYSGRIGVYEYLEPNPAMLTALRNGNLDAFAAASRSSAHMYSLMDGALDYAAAGVTTLEEVRRVVAELGES
ncbi:MAG: MSHA biogenesis protein MshE [Gammaproteobacteria bacterium HGW-Gammaproteobacteria-4]|jgi:MSHA biogenesis protein MshE|nr:MAG: MSHA biogenesis protein MshE [Gammaproteobacteria bacterium HGW-Gammaproteobacteria-4]